MSSKLPDRVRMSVTGTPGTGDVSLNLATSGYQTFTNAGVSTGDTFPYVIEDGANWEIGLGTYNSSGPSFARTTVRASSGGGTSKISASSNAIVYSSIMGQDIPALPAPAAVSNLADATITSPANNDVLTYNSTDVKWENKPPAAGGSALTISNNGTAVDTAATTINFVNATSITTSSHDVTVTLPTGGGGGGGGGGGSAPTIVQNGIFTQSDAPFVMSSTPTPGNLLVACISHWSNGTFDAGWSVLNTDATATNDYYTTFYKVATSADTTSLSPMTGSYQSAAIYEIAGAATIGLANVRHDIVATSVGIATIAPAGALVIGLFSTTGGGGGAGDGTAPTSMTGASQGSTATLGTGSGSPRAATAFSTTTTVAGGVDVVATYDAAANTNASIVVIAGGGGGGSGLNPPTLASWSEQALGSGVTVSATYAAGKGLNLTRTDNGLGSDHSAFQGKAIPSGSTWEATCQIRHSNFNTAYMRGGFALYNNSSGKFLVGGYSPSNGSPVLTLFYCSSMDTYTTGIVNKSFIVNGSVPEWFRIDFDGLNYNFHYSYDDVTYYLLGSAAIGTYFTATHIGIGMEVYNTISDACGLTALNYREGS